MQHSSETPHPTPIPAQSGTIQPGTAPLTGADSVENAAPRTPNESLPSGVQFGDIQFLEVEEPEIIECQEMARLFGLVPRPDAQGWDGINPFGKGGVQDTNKFTLWNAGHAHDYTIHKTYSDRETQQKARELLSQGRRPADELARQYAQRAALGTLLPPFDWEVATRYNYHNEDGQLLFQVGRLDTPIIPGGKQFRQRCLDDLGLWNRYLNGVPRVLYNLPFLKNAGLIIICEGEKVADQINRDLVEAGLIGQILATTSPQGAGFFSLVDASPLFGHKVAIFPDNDTPGALYGDAVLAALEAQAEVTVVKLPGLGKGSDYVDFRRTGHSLQEALDLILAESGWDRAVITPPAK